MKKSNLFLLPRPLFAFAILAAVVLLFPVNGNSLQANSSISKRLYSSSELKGRDLKVITTSGVSKVTPDNIDSFPTNAIFAERIEQSTRDLQSGEVMLPFSYRTLLPSGDELSFRAKLIVLKPIAFDNESDTFKGRLGLGVLSDSHPHARGEFEQPVSFTLAGEADSISPSQLNIAHLNQPFEEVEVALKEPDEVVSLLVFASFAPDEPEEVNLDSSRPQLRISIAPSSIDGFGLAVADVRVEALKLYAGRTVSLGYDKGRVEQSILQLDQNGNGRTQIRSQFVGEASITARGYPFADATALVVFSWPIALFIVGMLGAFGGAFIRKIVKNESKTNFGVAVFCGFLGTLLAALGVNFLKLPVTIPAGEAFAFVVAAISAYAGSAIFSMVTPKVT